MQLKLKNSSLLVNYFNKVDVLEDFSFENEGLKMSIKISINVHQNASWQPLSRIYESDLRDSHPFTRGIYVTVKLALTD